MVVVVEAGVEADAVAEAGSVGRRKAVVLSSVAVRWNLRRDRASAVHVLVSPMSECCLIVNAEG